MINPAAIPQFTGNLEELEGAASGLKGDAGDIAETGGDIHSTFQGLSAFYDAPEADQLFASTKPVTDTAKSFGHDVEQVASALSDYAHEVRPIADTLKRLKAEATTFYDDVKDDDDWQYDGDKVARNNDLLHQVDVAVAAFWAAERKAANRIDALFGGTRYVANDGSNASNMYGYSADQLDHAKLPWGSSEEEKHHWYEVGHWIKSFVWDGLIVDGVWGTLKGLGGLAGFQGWDTFVASWKGLGELGIGLASYGFGIPGVQQAAMAVPDSWLPGWVQESRKTTREAGKALLAWDEWGHNPARAAGGVTFNVLTVLAGGEGMAAKAGGLGKVGGGVARVADVLGKAGRVIDPMTYVVKGVGKLPKISEIAKALDGLKTGDIQGLDDLAKVDGVELPDGSVKMPDGTVLHPNGEVHLPNGEVHAHAEANVAHGEYGTSGGTSHADPATSGPAGEAHSPADPGSSHGPADPGVGHSSTDAGGSHGGTDSMPPANGSVGSGETHVPGTSHLSPADWNHLTAAERIHFAEAQISEGTVPFHDDAAAARYGADHWNDYAEHLPPLQKQAVFDYTMEPPHTGPTYQEMNGYLRGDSSLGTPEVLNDIAEVDKAMAGNPVPENIVVTRGTGLGHYGMPPLAMEGKVFTDHSYMSTSLGGPAPAFAGKEAVLHLRVPKGTHALWVEKVSAFGGGERELLLGRGQSYRVDRVVRHNGQWQIYGEILPKP